MNPANISTISGRSRRSSGSPPDRNTRGTPVEVVPDDVPAVPRLGSGICRVSEQNPQPKSHLLVTWTMTDSGTVAASASAAASAPAARMKWCPLVKETPGAIARSSRMGIAGMPRIVELVISHPGRRKLGWVLPSLRTLTAGSCPARRSFPSHLERAASSGNLSSVVAMLPARTASDPRRFARRPPWIRMIHPIPVCLPLCMIANRLTPVPRWIALYWFPSAGGYCWWCAGDAAGAGCAGGGPGGRGIMPASGPSSAGCGSRCAGWA